MGAVTTLFCGIIAGKGNKMTNRYAMKQYGRKMKRNGIAFAAVAAVFAACAAPATARTLDVTAYDAKPAK